MNSALALAIIGLGDTLKLQTVAEGIGRAEQCVALIGLACELGQGYYFSRPVPPAGIDALLASGVRMLPEVVPMGRPGEAENRKP